MQRRNPGLIILILTLAVLAIADRPPANAQDLKAAPFHFIAFGDMPYNMPSDAARFKELLAEIGIAKPAFAVHVGDIKNGISQCSTERFQKIRSYFDSFSGALIYTPGDNDWADCDRILAGGYDTRERLNELRRIFFPQQRSMGSTPISLVRQADTGSYPEMVENAIWHHGGVTFATVHLVGSDNNLSDDRSEFEARNKANLDWIAGAFRLALERKSIGVVLLFHADIFSRYAPAAAFADTVAAIAAGAERFDRPVLLVDGDAHTYGIDHPIRHSKTGHVNSKITRLIVFGGSDLRAVTVSVDPKTPNLFSISPLATEEN